MFSRDLNVILRIRRLWKQFCRAHGGPAPPSSPFQAKYSEVGEPLEDIISISIFSKSALNWQNPFDFSPRTMTGINYVTTLLFKLNVYLSARNTVYYFGRNIYHYYYLLLLDDFKQFNQLLFQFIISIFWLIFVIRKFSL